MEHLEHKRLGDLAAQQHGVFKRSEAVGLGVTSPSIDKRVLLGLYRRVQPGVYVVSGSPTSAKQRLAAVVLSFPQLAAVSHQTAAELWGLTNRGIRSLEVVTTRWDRVRRDGVTVHESLDLLAEDVIDCDGIPVTSPVRTVVDLGASNKWIVEAALEQGIRADLFSLSQVEALVARVARRGRRGVGVIRPLLEERRRWDSATESVLEDEFRKAIARADLPAPVEQYVVTNQSGGFVCRADFAYPEAEILIELDSEAHHLDRLTFRRDRKKQNNASVLGWTVLRYTWWDLKERPYEVVGEIRTMLRNRAPHVLADLALPE